MTKSLIKCDHERHVGLSLEFVVIKWEKSTEFNGTFGDASMKISLKGLKSPSQVGTTSEPSKSETSLHH